MHSIGIIPLSAPVSWFVWSSLQGNSVSSNCRARWLFKICPRVPLEWSTICYDIALEFSIWCGIVKASKIVVCITFTKAYDSSSFSPQCGVMQEGPYLKSKGRASDAIRIVVLTWRSLLIMSRDWKYYWSRLALYMFIALSIGTIFSDIGHSLSSVMVSFIVELLCFDSLNSWSDDVSPFCVHR